MELDETMTNGKRTIRVKKFNVVQSALTYATVVAIFCFIMLLFMFLLGGLFGGMMSGIPGIEELGAGIGGSILALIIGPIIYFIIFFIIGLIGLSIYNLAAQMTGGFEFTSDK